MSGLRKFNDYIDSILNTCSMYDFRDKHTNLSNQIRYMLNRTQSLFEYNGLPDTIPKRILEQYLQINTHCAFVENPKDHNLYIVKGSRGGELDVNFEPTVYTVANPAMPEIDGMYKINEDCILIKNDTFFMGLLPIFKKYGSFMVENDISMQMASILSRIPFIIETKDDNTKDAADIFIRHILDGDLSVLGSAKFLDSLNVHLTSNSNNEALTNLIEFHQYIKASMFNEIGLNSNYNMKREAINSSEAQLNDDPLKPLIDDMLENRQMALDMVNAKWGTNITVKLSSIWKEKEIIDDAEIEMIENQADAEDPAEDEQINEPDEQEEEEIEGE